MENLEILDVGDYNISETITTTETWLAPFSSVTLPLLATVKTKLQYLLPFRRYSTGSTSPERDISLFFFPIIILIIKSFANFVRNDLLNLQRSNRSAFEIHDYNDSNISETITTTETTFVPSGSPTLALDFCWRRNSNISYRFGDIRPETQALNAIFLYSYYYYYYSFSFFPGTARPRISSYRNGPILEILTSYQS